MAFRFKLDEPLKTGFRRVSAEQFARALENLDGECVTASDVHECRKSIKRLRALLRLTAPALGAKEARRCNVALRDAGRLMSGRRDAAVFAETLASIGKDMGAGGDTLIASISAALGLQTTNADVSLEPAIAIDVRRRLARQARQFAKLPIKETSFEPLRRGLEASYRKARRNLATAEARPSDEAFHEFRKTVQWHWRHMALLSKAWPEVCEVRIEAARQLSQHLGEDHDLAVLGARVAANPQLSQEQSDAFAQYCAARHGVLREQSERIAGRLFAERPAAFADRISAYWSASGQSEAWSVTAQLP